MKILNEDFEAHGPFSQALVAFAAALATHGYITEVEYLCLADLDLYSMSPWDLVNLVRCVNHLSIYGGVHGDLGPVLDNVECCRLYIWEKKLSAAETQSLLTAMVTRVKVVELNDVALDWDVLSQYDGKGACVTVEWDHGHDTTGGHRDQMKMWAVKMDWKHEVDQMSMPFYGNYWHNIIFKRGADDDEDEEASDDEDEEAAKDEKASEDEVANGGEDGHQ